MSDRQIAGSIKLWQVAVAAICNIYTIQNRAAWEKLISGRMAKPFFPNLCNCLCRCSGMFERLKEKFNLTYLGLFPLGKSPSGKGMDIKMNGNASAFDALEYDGKIKKTLPYYECFYEQVTDIVRTRWNKPLTWLDIGCGTGKMAEAAFETVKINKFVFCDSSSDMISIVKKRFEDKNAEFITSSVLELDAIDKFDVVTSIQVFHYLQTEERVEAVKKCYKALSPNGVFITFENFAPYSEAGKHLFLRRWKEYQISQGRDVKECDGHISRYGKDYYPITISEHLKVLEESGFGNAEIIWVSNMQVGLLGIK